MEIAILVFPVFASYAIRIHSVTSRLGELLAEEVEGLQAGQIQKWIAPPSQARSLWVAVLLGALILALGFHLWPWYGALGGFALSFALILLMNYFIPSEKTPHYLMVILKNLGKKAEALEAQGDGEAAEAQRDLMEKLQSLSGKRRLFEEKETGY
ncbi:MAG: hypothetical protein U1F66_01695 [bacterium]